jgi:hypothetical protein
MLDLGSWLRVARGIAKNETLASIRVFRTLKRRGHPEGPPATISDGWGGIDAAMIEVYGVVPEYSGRGRRPTRKQARAGWLYLPMVKPRDARVRVKGNKLQVVLGKKSEVIALLGTSTAYIECSNLTSRLFNGWQVRKTLAFSKEIAAYRAAAVWKDCYYNLLRPYKSLRLPVAHAAPQKWLQRTSAIAAKLTDHIWTVKQPSTTSPLPDSNNT